MMNDREYQICSAIAKYLLLKYPKVIFHYDYAGLNLSKAQAGRMKAIQGKRGYPDLFIAEAKGDYHGLFIELKAEGTKLYTIKRHSIDYDPANPHIAEQAEMITRLREKGYYADFACGTDEAMAVIDQYMQITHQNMNL